MAQINPSLSGKLETVFDAKIKAAYKSLTNTSACAGLRNAGDKYKNYTLAQIAKINHYGAIITREDKSWVLPPREFVTAATRGDTDLAEYMTELRKAIVEQIREATPRHYEHWSTPTSEGTEYSYTRDVQSRPFGGELGKHHGPFQIMQAIAAAMAENQRTAIYKHDFPAGASSNAESTVEQKGFDFPLVKSGKLLTRIDSWVERAK